MLSAFRMSTISRMKPIHVPGVTHCPLHNAGLASKEVDEMGGGALRENGTIYRSLAS